MSKPPPPRVAVIGAGPIGIEAALYAKACGLPVAVYDRGGIAEHVRRWGHVRLFTPFGMNTTPLGLKTLRAEKPSRDLPADADLLTGREFRDAYLVPLAESEVLLESLFLETAVLQVGRAVSRKRVPPSRPRRQGSRTNRHRGRGARLHRHLRDAEVARRRRHPRGGRTGGAAAHRQRTGRHPGRAARTTTRARASRSSATATPPRRRSARSRRSRRSTPRRGCSG